MDQHGFRGIDLDWEYPGSSMGGLKHRENDWDNYLSLMELLRVELDAREAATGKDYILSVALGANKSLINAVDGTRLSSLVDQVNLMTYDFTGFDRTTGHHAALYPDEDNPLAPLTWCKPMPTAAFQEQDAAGRRLLRPGLAPGTQQQ